MEKGAVINVPKNTHDDRETVHYVLQQAMNECYLPHQKPTSRINVGLVVAQGRSIPTPIFIIKSVICFLEQQPVLCWRLKWVKTSPMCQKGDCNCTGCLLFQDAWEIAETPTVLVVGVIRSDLAKTSLHCQLVFHTMCASPFFCPAAVLGCWPFYALLDRS